MLHKRGSSMNQQDCLLIFKGVERVGNGVSPCPPNYVVWGSVGSSPTGVRGRALAKNDFTAFWACPNAFATFVEN